MTQPKSQPLLQSSDAILNRDATLQVTEIYASIQGESSYTGYPCVFVRLTGCPLRCRWCDTSYGFEGGDSQTIEAILSQVKSYGIPLVEVTGGEPLAQEHSLLLIDALNHASFQVLLETGGSIAIKNVHNQTHIIMDIKCPDSGMSHLNYWDNLNDIKPSDEIKFVIASPSDYQWACKVVDDYQLDPLRVLFSPAFGLVKPQDLVEWMVRDQVAVRLNLQIHKYIWSPRVRGV